MDGFAVGMNHCATQLVCVPNQSRGSTCRFIPPAKLSAFDSVVNAKTLELAGRFGACSHVCNVSELLLNQPWCVSVCVSSGVCTVSSLLDTAGVETVYICAVKAQTAFKGLFYRPVSFI